jgi:hypothetical protein
MKLLDLGDLDAPVVPLDHSCLAEFSQLSGDDLSHRTDRIGERLVVYADDGAVRRFRGQVKEVTAHTLFNGVEQVVGEKFNAANNKLGFRLADMVGVQPTRPR